MKYQLLLSQIQSICKDLNIILPSKVFHHCLNNSNVISFKELLELSTLEFTLACMDADKEHKQTWINILIEMMRILELDFFTEHTLDTISKYNNYTTSDSEYSKIDFKYTMLLDQFHDIENEVMMSLNEPIYTDDTSVIAKAIICDLINFIETNKNYTGLFIYKNIITIAIAKTVNTASQNNSNNDYNLDHILHEHIYNLILILRNIFFKYITI